MKSYYNNKKWQRYRKLQLQDYPLCFVCFTKYNKTTEGSTVDHIIPINEFNYDDYMFEFDNYMTLCHKCHGDITATQKNVDFSNMEIEEARTYKINKIRTSNYLDYTLDT